MRAVVLRNYGGPDSLQVEEVDDPRCGDDQVLVRVGACGVCGHDRLARQGRLATPLPAVLGHEVAGTVCGTGRDVEDLAIGDRVALVQREPCGACGLCRSDRTNLCRSGRGFYGEDRPGGYSELVLASERNAVLLPSTLPFTTGAILSCAVGTGWHALHRVGVTQGEVVVVTGAGGGVGVHAVQLARHLGATVVAVTSTPHKIQQLQDLGAHHVALVPARGSIREQVLEFTDGQLADVVLDLAGPPTFEGALRTLAPSGRLALIGNVDPRDVPLPPGLMILKEVSVVGCAHGTREDLEAVVELVQGGHIRPIVDGEYSLEETAAAHAAVDGFGRHVVVP